MGGGIVAGVELATAMGDPAPKRASVGGMAAKTRDATNPRGDMFLKAVCSFAQSNTGQVRPASLNARESGLGDTKRRPIDQAACLRLKSVSWPEISGVQVQDLSGRGSPLGPGKPYHRHYITICAGFQSA